MRLDKYLKVSRLIKRRTLAKEFLDFGGLLINGKVAKPSSEVKENDILEMNLRDRILKVKVLQIKETTKTDEDSSMYEVISESKKEQI